MRARIFLGALALGLALAPAARAQSGGALVSSPPVIDNGATTAWVANNPTLNELDDRAAAYWSKRGIAFQRTDTIFLVDKCDCGAYEAHDQIYLTEDLVDRMSYNPRDRDSAEEVCTEVFHEKGHVLDLVFDQVPGDPYHTYTGLMSAYGETPWECKVWARDRAKAARLARLRSSRRH